MKRDGRQILTELHVLNAQGGDEAAFRELHGLWTADLLSLARVRVDGEAHARDVVQDAWVAMARGLRELDDPACFPRWAMQVVHRRCVDWVRGRLRDRRKIEALMRERGPIDGVVPPDMVRESDELAALRESIARLDHDDRELVHLYYVAERSVPEIADILVVPAGTVKSRLFAVRERLKTQIERILP